MVVLPSRYYLASSPVRYASLFVCHCRAGGVWCWCRLVHHPFPPYRCANFDGFLKFRSAIPYYAASCITAESVFNCNTNSSADCTPPLRTGEFLEILVRAPLLTAIYSRRSLHWQKPTPPGIRSNSTSPW
jgi:hypothetical protein